MLKYFKLYKLFILIVKLTVTKLTNMKTNKKTDLFTKNKYNVYC